MKPVLVLEPTGASSLATIKPMSDPGEVPQAALELAPRDRAELVDAVAASLDGFDLGTEWGGGDPAAHRRC
jgi:hypothetical protein